MELNVRKVFGNNKNFSPPVDKWEREREKSGYKYDDNQFQFLANRFFFLHNNIRKMKSDFQMVNTYKNERFFQKFFQIFKKKESTHNFVNSFHRFYLFSH